MLKLLTVLSYILVLTVGPLILIARILFKGKRAIITVPLVVLGVWGTYMYVIANSDDTHETATARAPSPAAARPAAEAPASAPRGVVVKAEGNRWFVRWDEPNGESSFVALRICGGNSPDAPAVSTAPQGQVLLENITRTENGNVLQIRDAQRPDVIYQATTAECPSPGQSEYHNRDTANAPSP